jgi:hypothetical protein
MTSHGIPGKTSTTPRTSSTMITIDTLTSSSKPARRGAWGLHDAWNLDKVRRLAFIPFKTTVKGAVDVANHDGKTRVDQKNSP